MVNKRGKKTKDTEIDDEKISRDSCERLKLEKSKSKAAFTKARHSLLQLRDEEDLPSRTEIQKAREKLNVCLDKAMMDLSRISAFYESEGTAQTPLKYVRK